MLTRSLGNTGLNVSILGFGASPLGGVFGPVEQTEATEIVHAAIDGGINLFDVAPFYGKTRAETSLGIALRGVERSQYVLATKVGRFDLAEFDFSAQRTIRSVDESLGRLQTDYIDLIQCHDIEFGSLDQIVDETIPALNSLKDQGKIRFVGITGLPLKIFPYVLERTTVDTILSYCHYTLYDTSLMTILPEALAGGVGIINAAPLGMGLLTSNVAPVWHPAPLDLKLACIKAAEYCRERGEDIAQIALSFALANPDISSTLVGMGSMSQLQSNLACVGSVPESDLVADIHHLFRQVECVTWPSGMLINN